MYYYTIVENKWGGANAPVSSSDELIAKKQIWQNIHVPSGSSDESRKSCQFPGLCKSNKPTLTPCKCICIVHRLCKCLTGYWAL